MPINLKLALFVKMKSTNTLILYTNIFIFCIQQNDITFIITFLHHFFLGKKNAASAKTRHKKPNIMYYSNSSEAVSPLVKCLIKNSSAFLRLFAFSDFRISLCSLSVNS